MQEKVRNLDDRDFEIIEMTMEKTLSEEVSKLEKKVIFLASTGTSAPFMGLLGTVVGMIKVFAAIMIHGVGDPGILAGGISEALITTAAGLTVAIPSLIFHRYFERLIDEYVLKMEEESLKLIDIIQGDRESEDELPSK